ncbi:MAG: hypothetical protein CSA35_02150 [Dethiosulfovibrio peptidovorans]|nr:MAG: hypothetical protein CSA35_02150 [Dethiosulfovibrio peptidovorans]
MTCIRFAKTSIVAMAFLGATAALAAPISLKDAVQIAVQQDIDVLKSLEDRHKSDAGAMIARSALFPSLNLRAHYTVRDERHALAGDGTAGGISLVAVQPLYTGGRATALLRQSEAYDRSTQAAVTNSREQVALVVVSQFSRVLQLRENVAAGLDSVTFAKSHLKETIKKEALGVANHFEVTRARQQLSVYETQLITAKNDLEAAAIALRTTLRLPPNEPTEIQGDLEFRPYTGDKDGSLERALTSRGDLTSATARVEMQKEQIQIVASGLRPQVNLKGVYSWDDPKDGDGSADDDWQVILNAEVPIFDRNITKGEVQAEQATLRQQELELARLVERIKSDVSQAWLDLETARQTVEATSTDLGLSSEALRLAQVGYREGVSPQIDVLDAQASYARSRKDRAAAVRSYMVQVATIQRMEGHLVAHILNDEGGSL